MLEEVWSERAALTQLEDTISVVANFSRGVSDSKASILR